MKEFQISFKNNIIMLYIFLFLFPFIFNKKTNIENIKKKIEILEKKLDLFGFLEKEEFNTIIKV